MNSNEDGKLIIKLDLDDSSIDESLKKTKQKINSSKQDDNAKYDSSGFFNKIYDDIDKAIKTTTEKLIAGFKKIFEIVKVVIEEAFKILIIAIFAVLYLIFAQLLQFLVLRLQVILIHLFAISSKTFLFNGTMMVATIMKTLDVVIRSLFMVVQQRTLASVVNLFKMISFAFVMNITFLGKAIYEEFKTIFYRFNSFDKIKNVFSSYVKNELDLVKKYVGEFAEYGMRNKDKGILKNLQNFIYGIDTSSSVSKALSVGNIKLANPFEALFIYLSGAIRKNINEFVTNPANNLIYQFYRSAINSKNNFVNLISSQYGYIISNVFSNVKNFIETNKTFLNIGSYILEKIFVFKIGWEERLYPSLKTGLANIKSKLLEFLTASFNNVFVGFFVAQNVWLPKFKQFWSNIVSQFTVEALTNRFNQIKQIALNTFSYLKTYILSISGAISKYVKNEFEILIPAFSMIFNYIKQNGVRDLGFISSLFKALAKDSTRFINDFANGMKDGVSIKNIEDLAYNLMEFSETLSIAGSAVGLFDASIVASFQRVMFYGSLMVTALKIGIFYILTKFSDSIYEYGKNLSKHFTDLYNKYLEFRKETIVFTSTIQAFNNVSQDAIGTSSEWSGVITNLSKSLNLSVKDLRKSSAEIVAVGYRLGFTKDQMTELLKVVSGYSVISGKDLYDTTVAFTSALQGQAMAVQSYGVKLTEASNSHYALMHGVKKSFTQMSDAEKYQVRLNNLISQYGVVSGVASDVANDWFKNSQKLAITQENVNIKMGEGAVIIEDFNLFSLIANKFLNLFNDTLLKMFGFFGAFGSRMIQITGLVLGLSLKFALLSASIKLVNTYLASNVWSVFATKTIPILNINLKEMAMRASGSGRELNSVKNIFITLFDAIMKNKSTIIGFFIGVGGVASIGPLLTGIFSKLSAFSLVVLSTFGRIALAILPITLTLSIVYSLFVLFKEAITLIDAKTGIFTDTIDSLKSSFPELTGYVMESKSVFTELGKIVSHVTGTILGGFTHDLNTGILAALKSYRFLASAFISDKSKQALDEKIFKLSDFNKKLELAGMNANKLTQELNQASKATFEKPKENLEELMNQFKEASEFIKTNPKKLAEELSMRLALVKQNLAAEVISEKQAQEQIAIFKAASAKKVVELLNQINTDSILSPEEKASKDYAKSMADLNAIYNQDLINFTTYNQKKWEIAQVYGNEIQKIIEEQRQKEADKIKESKENAYSMVDVARETVGAIKNIIGGSLERLGAQLVEGGSAWDDYASFIYDVLGNLMIQVGMGIIGISSALQALQAAIASWNWPLSLAAGIALVVAGGALKALAKSSKSTSTGSYQPTSSMPGGSSPGTDYNPINPRENINTQKEQQVVINIQGSLISTEQTSRTLIDMIAKEFDKSGAKIRTRAFA